jgi:hypothetical protein
VAFYIAQSDLENATSPQTVLACFDDGSGQINQNALNSVLARACGQVDSYLARVFKPPFPVVQAPAPQMIQTAATDFAVAYMFERHPEYVKTYSEKRAELWKRASAMMERICDGLQELPDYTAQPKQRNIGGPIYTPAYEPRTIIDARDGTYQGGDF